MSSARVDQIRGLIGVCSLIIFSAVLVACVGSNIKIKRGVETDRMVAKIKTDTDPRFVYRYEKTKFVPPEGKTLLIMGQTLEGINEYLSAFPDMQTPGGWSSYWAITEFRGVTEAHRNITGSSQNHQMLVDNFPNTVMHSAMWMVGKWGVATETAAGKYDDIVKQYAAWAKSIERPIYLRIGYEFDGQHNELEPQEYVTAYRRIVDLLRKEGVTNIAYVWHSYAAPRFKGYPLSAWYPGDDYVDWVGISVFGHVYEKPALGSDGDTVLEFARERRKPVMIAEANPVNGIARQGSEVWDRWFVNFFSLVYDKNIKAISFINEDWRRLKIDGIEGWGDARLYNNAEVSSAWFRETEKSRYLKQSPELFPLLGYVLSP